MRKLAMLATALVCLGYALPSFAQGESGPQPGLPPGAGIDAPNAGQPPPSGRISSSPSYARPVTVAPSAPIAKARPVRVRARRVRHHFFRRFHRVRHVPAAAVAPAAPVNQ